MNVEIVKVKLKEAFPYYDFDRAGIEVRPKDKVIVASGRGLLLGTVLSSPWPLSEGAPLNLEGSIVRLASPEDLEQHNRNLDNERRALALCLEKVAERNLPMKVKEAEYLFDGSKAIFYFTAEGRIDFRELVKHLARQLKTRIEMRQIGVRDETSMTGGIGYCGRTLCCATFLKEFAPVSIKAAKDQGLALNLEKISGVCGRLMCCLTYEQSVYEELKSCLPKCGKRVLTEKGPGKVVKLKVLEGMVVVKLADGQLLELKSDQVGPA